MYKLNRLKTLVLTEAVMIRRNSLSPLSKSKGLFNMRDGLWELSRMKRPLSSPDVILYWTSELGVLGLSLSKARIPLKIVNPVKQISC